MLVLSRHLNESIIIGDDIVIQVVEISRDKVRLGINAPRSIPVHRKEIYESIKRESDDASAPVRSLAKPKGSKPCS